MPKDKTGPKQKKKSETKYECGAKKREALSSNSPWERSPSVGDNVAATAGVVADISTGTFMLIIQAEGWVTSDHFQKGPLATVWENTTAGVGLRDVAQVLAQGISITPAAYCQGNRDGWLVT